MKELVNQGLVLISIEMIMDKFIEIRPRALRNLGFDGLVLEGGRTIKVHLKYANP